MDALIARFHRVLLAALAVCALLPCAAQAQAASETAVKAALVFRLASYVEWPPRAFASPDSPVVIGVMGSEEIAAQLEVIARGRTLNNRPIVVRRIKEGESLAGLHALFIGRRDAERVSAIARLARPLSILLVSDSERGLEAGSVINFVPVEDRVGFDVSVEAAEQSGLRLSSRMLGVARRVLAKSA